MRNRCRLDGGSAKAWPKLHPLQRALACACSQLKFTFLSLTALRHCWTEMQISLVLLMVWTELTHILGLKWTEDKPS